MDFVVVRGRQSKSRYGIAGCGWNSLKAFGRAFGKPSSLFIASWPVVLRRPVELAE